MHDNASHPLLAQIPLAVSPYISLPTATTLPYQYKTLPSTLPPSSTGTESNANYVVSSGGHSAHPNDIIATCKALQAYIQKVQDDADAALKEWDEKIQARDLAEKRRLAPGWLDSNVHGILEPEKKGAKEEKSKQRDSLMDMDTSTADAQPLPPATVGTGAGDELDRAFGGMGI